MRRPLVAVAALAATLAAGCVPGDVGDAFGFAVDWAQSDDPGLQAAARAAEEVESERIARDHFERGLRSGEPEDFEVAAGLRPLDPRYAMYAAVLHSAAEQPGRARPRTQQVLDALKARHPHDSHREIQRRFAELQLETLHDLILRGGNTDVLGAMYCSNLTKGYPQLFGDTAEGAFYLTLADYSICADR